MTHSNDLANEPTDQQNSLHFRIILAAFGAMAGFALWGLFEFYEQVSSKHLWASLIAFVGLFSSCFLKSMGPLPRRDAIKTALIVAIPLTVLFYITSQRFGNFGDFMRSPHAVFSCAIIAFIALPFLFAKFRAGEKWNDYPTLFDHAWQITVRVLVATVFVGIVWLVLTLSNEVLKIVRIYMLKDLMRNDAFQFAFSGGVFGLGMAVLWELRRTVSPMLVLWLLRLLLPFVTIITVIFLVALAVSGINDVFGSLSPAATLMGLAFLGAGLVTVALDVTDTAAAGQVIRRFALVLSLALPILATVAVYGVWVRVDLYGWTPQRLVAATLALIALGYGVLYAVSVFRRKGWMEAIRQANVRMALAVMAVIALWMTPVLNAQRISVASQLARFETGKTETANLPIWEMQNRWGKAGQKGLTALAQKSDHPDFQVITEAIEAAQSKNGRYVASNVLKGKGKKAGLETIKTSIIALPEGAQIPEDMWQDMSDADVNRIAMNCSKLTEEGHSGCAAIVDRFGGEGEAVVFISALSNGRGHVVAGYEKQALNWTRFHPQTMLRSGSHVQFDYIDVVTGAYSIGPSQRQTLKIGDAEFYR